MGFDLAVERFRQVQRVRRAYNAADDRKDHEASATLESELTLAEQIESVTPPTSDEGAALKLKTAAGWAAISADSVGGVDCDLVPAIRRILRAMAGNRLTLKGLIELRAILPRASVDPHVSAPLRFAVDWWSRPRTVE